MQHTLTPKRFSTSARLAGYSTSNTGSPQVSPCTCPAEVNSTPLGIALNTGFHSLVELLARHEQSQELKNRTLRHAVSLKRPDFSELLVSWGDQLCSVPFVRVLRVWHPAIIRYFLVHGADIITVIRSRLPSVIAFKGSGTFRDDLLSHLGESNVPKNVPTTNLKELSYREAKKSPQLAPRGKVGWWRNLKLHEFIEFIQEIVGAACWL
jgi:hypothetical protein